ncbi:MAG: hypothetical protein KAS32_18710 [Candidatus Peribacteraceae bacterium]|nr:hypothetical protein [Candidatus Peribacteraceae bacterium]
MLNKVQRHCQDVFLRKMLHDTTDSRITERERMDMLLTSYLGKNSNEQNIYMEVLQDLIEHIDKGTPFMKSIKYKRIEDNLYIKRDRDERWDAKHYKKQVLQELEVFGFLRPRLFGIS